MPTMKKPPPPPIKGKPLNMNPEDYVREIIKQQQDYIKELEGQIGGEDGSRFTFEYSYSANNAEPPGQNQVRLNTTAQEAASIMWASQISNDGVDITNAVTIFHAGDNAFVQDKNDAASYAHYTLNADPILKSGYVEFPVTFVDGGNSLNGGQLAILSLSEAT